MSYIMNVRKLSATLGLCAVASVLLGSCVAPTPADRIAENPVIFNSLPANQQVLVQRGQICNGMTPDAVLLAWGAPDTAPIIGEKNNHKTERWVYRRYEPVTVVADMPYGPYGLHGCCDPFYSNTGTAFIPQDVAFVEFTDGKVSSWARATQ